MSAFPHHSGANWWLFIATVVVALWPSGHGSTADVSIDPQTIITRVRLHADDYITQSAQYKFYATVLTEDLDSKGVVKTRREEEEHIFHIRGRRYVRRLSVNGKPLSGDALVREESRERVFREQKAAARAKADSSDLAGRPDRRWVRLTDLLDRYEYQLIRTEFLNGRQTYVLNYRPRRGLPVHERRDLVFNKLAGTVWVDAREYRIAKADGHLIENIRIGLIALNLTTVSIHYEQQQVEPGVWLPSRAEVRFIGSIFLVKQLNRRAVLQLYDFVRSEAD